MKNFYLISALILGLVTSTVSLAADMKIGFVNAKAIAVKLPQSKTMMINIQNEFKERVEQLKKLEAGIRALQEKGQKEAATMTVSAVTSLKRDIEQKVSQLKLEDTNMKEDVRRRQQEEAMKLNRAIGQAIEALATRDNFDLLLYKDSIVFAGDKIIDITDDVVKMMTDPKFN